MSLNLSNRGASTAIASLGTQFDAGFIRIYAGAQPVDANTNTSGANFVLAECPFAATAGSAVSSTWTAAAMAATTATSTGVALFYRAVTSSQAVILDGAVSTAGADMNFNTNSIVQGASVQVTTYVLILPEH